MVEEKISSGIVAPDPASLLPGGSQLDFKAILVQYSPADASAWVKDWESVDGILLAMTFSDPNFHRTEGSAVVVAPGIALCASHVIKQKLEAVAAGREAVTCFGITAAGLQIWRGKKITLVPNSDLAILGLELASELRSGATLCQTAITTRLPKVGETVTIFGFRAGEEAIERTSGKTRFSGNVIVCAGQVVAHHLTGRDSFMMPWPALEIACPSWGGMSGGPVFDTTGRLLGLLSSSLTTIENTGPSYVSLLIPAMTTRFEGGWPGSLFTNPSTLLDLDPRICSIDKREAFSVLSDEATGMAVTKYTVWD